MCGSASHMDNVNLYSYCLMIDAAVQCYCCAVDCDSRTSFFTQTLMRSLIVVSRLERVEGASFFALPTLPVLYMMHNIPVTVMCGSAAHMDNVKLYSYCLNESTPVFTFLCTLCSCRFSTGSLASQVSFYWLISRTAVFKKVASQ